VDVLETARLVIRPFAPEDLDAAHQILDRDLAWTGPGYTRERRRARLEFYASLADWADTGRLFGYRAVVRRVGMVTAANPDREAVWPGVVGVLEAPG
jgi:hypothetical protein